MFRIKYSREAVLKLLYQVDVLGLDLKTQIPHQLLQDNLNFFRGLNKAEKEFILNILTKVIEEKDTIDDMISKNLIGWKLERLMPVERSLLRMGIAESYFNKPKAIFIDDIVRVAKKYGTDDSYKIINAILDKVIQ
jgi:N utilization substance protein B